LLFEKLMGIKHAYSRPEVEISLILSLYKYLPAKNYFFITIGKLMLFITLKDVIEKSA